MQKTFITILSILYLVSAIGFGSVQHYCEKLQKLTSPSKSDCCSTEPHTEAAASVQQLVTEHAISSGGTLDACVLMQSSDAIFFENCCDVQHTYNQLDSSTLPLNVDVSQLADQSGGELYYFPQRPQTNDGCMLNMLADSSIQINLPLLI